MNKNVQHEKNSLSIFTTLSIPTVTSHPSLKTVQWSADGQLAFVTKNAVIILVRSLKFSHRRWCYFKKRLPKFEI